MSSVQTLLTQAAETIRTLEREAQEALHGQGDKEAYTAKLTEKCHILLDLGDRLEEPLEAVRGKDSAEAARIEAQLDSYAQRANAALSLKSVFFMAALLYPDDYKDGEPNDLERFVESLGE